MAEPKLIFTIGHSTRTTRDFIRALRTYDIELLVDIRHYPGSRHCPQFSKTRLKRNLARNGIDYLHLVGLGGRRASKKGSDLNAGWMSPQFRGYADYMQTKDFKLALKELLMLAEKKTVAIMCSEALPWRCHRSMVGDALLVHGFEVLDIFDEKNVRPHSLTPFAKVRKKRITYPSPGRIKGLLRGPR